MIDTATFILYGIEWITGVITWGATADKLQTGSCYFIKMSNCGVIIFAGALAWLGLCGVIAARVLPHIQSKYTQITPEVERNCCFGLSGVWAIVALVASATAPATNRRTSGDVVIGAAWVNLIAHIASGVLAGFRDHHEDTQNTTVA